MKKLAIITVAATILTACSTDWIGEDGWDDNTSSNTDSMVLVNGIDVSKYAQARVFPGLVDTATERHIDTTVVLDLSRPYKSMSDLNLWSYNFLEDRTNDMPLPIYSTGAYAGAGEEVTITLPEGNNFGLTAQIGMQSDSLYGASIYKREPVVYMQKTLYPGTNKLRFPLGGYIWLIRSTNAIGSSDQKVRISGGVYASHDYIIGKTNPSAWLAALRSTTVPWFDIRGNRIAISVNKDRILSMANSDPDFANNLDKCLGFWDRLIELYYMQLGLNLDNNDANSRMPYFHDRFIFDVNLTGSVLMHTKNAQGVMMLQSSTFYDELLSWKTIKNMKVEEVFSAIENKYMSRYNPRGTYNYVENGKIPLYRMSEELFRNGYAKGLADLGLDFNELLPTALDYAKADSVKSSSDAWVPGEKWNSTNTTIPNLLSLVQLAKYFNKTAGETEWSYLYNMARDYRLNQKYGSLESFFKELCSRYSVNLVPFYDHWGLSISDEARIYAEQFPMLKDQAWRIDPSAKDNPFANMGKYNERYRYRLSRLSWKGLATYDAKYGSENQDESNGNERYWNSVEKLFDCDKSTYWLSYIKKDDSPYELPYYVIVDMGAAQDIDGIYFANGYQKCVSGFTVQTLAATGDIDLAATKNSAWQNWGTVSQTRANMRYNERFVELGRRRTRYLRLVFTHDNLYNRPDETKDPDGAASFDKLHKKRQQSFAELGAWHY